MGINSKPDSSGMAPTMEQLRRVVQDWLEIALTPLAGALFRLGASANQVSVCGFALNLATAGLVATDHLVAAGVLYPAPCAPWRA